MPSASPLCLGQARSAEHFAHLMRELTYRNNGTFVALPSFK